MKKAIAVLAAACTLTMALPSGVYAVRQLQRRERGCP